MQAIKGNAIPVRNILRILLLGVVAVVLLRWLYHWIFPTVVTPTVHSTPAITEERVWPGMRRIVVSDLHLGGADQFERFFADQQFVTFMDQHVANNTPTELILAGDTFEFFFLATSGLDACDVSEQAAVTRINRIIQAHPAVIAALSRFLSQPDNQLTILIGNHDFELHYASVQAVLGKAFAIELPDQRLRFASSYTGGGLYIVHGSQFVSWHRQVYFEGITDPIEEVFGRRIACAYANQQPDGWGRWLAGTTQFLLNPTPRYVLDAQHSSAELPYDIILKAPRQTQRAGMAYLATRPMHRHTILFVSGHTHSADVFALNAYQTHINTGTWKTKGSISPFLARSESMSTFLEISYNPGTPTDPHWQLLIWDDSDHAPQPWK